MEVYEVRSFAPRPRLASFPCRLSPQKGRSEPGNIGGGGGGGGGGQNIDFRCAIIQTKDTLTLWKVARVKVNHILFITLLFIFQGTRLYRDPRHSGQLTLANRRSRKQQHTMSNLVLQTNRSEQRAQTSGPLAHLSSAFYQPLRVVLFLILILSP